MLYSGINDYRKTIKIIDTRGKNVILSNVLKTFQCMNLSIGKVLIY